MKQLTSKSEPTNSMGQGICDFKDRAPWWGGDLQTLRNHFLSRQFALPGSSSKRTFATSDGSGDRLTGTLERPIGADTNPLILLIHGLTGCEDSSYVRESARFHLVRRRPVLRLNLRGAGSSGKLARGYYHAGCASDLQDVLDGLGADESANGVFAIGFSLGGNILLNLLARLNPQHGLIGAATVSAPIEPFEACRRLMASRNALYQRFLLRRMKRDVLSSAEVLHQERENIERSTTVYEFDDRFVAPRNGFVDARDYYEKTAGARHVKAIEAPTLMLHACNDPWIPVSSYRNLRSEPLGSVKLIIARSGGHVGFHEHGSSETWHDRKIDGFLKRLLDA
jgi:predicted alpha/beta-fold hydrolase